jgi:hypothetical protein
MLTRAGYPLTPLTIRPFNDAELVRSGNQRQVQKLWNQALFHIRIKVEHAFGRLKCRFRGLQNFPGRDMRNINLTIEALIIIHNHI